ncbi:MAG: hypothetical protein AB1345_02085 [Chloroflexota bacterium]
MCRYLNENYRPRYPTNRVTAVGSFIGSGFDMLSGYSSGLILREDVYLVKAKSW